MSEEEKLLNCPFCGGEVKIWLTGDTELWWLISNKKIDNKTVCRVFMESDIFPAEELMTTGLKEKDELIKAWNTRTNKIPVGNGKDYTVVNE